MTPLQQYIVVQADSIRLALWYGGMICGGLAVLLASLIWMADDDRERSEAKETCYGFGIWAVGCWIMYAFLPGSASALVLLGQ